MPLKVNTPVNTFTAVLRLKSLSETFFLLTESPKVLLFATLKKELETEDVSPEPPVLTPPLSVTLMMDPRPESDYPLVPERLLTVLAELLLVSLLVVEELISPSLRLVTNSTNSPRRERTGLELEVLL